MAAVRALDIPPAEHAPPSPTQPRKIVVSSRVNITRYDDTDEDLCEQFHNALRPPWWYDPTLRPCNCEVDAVLTDQHIGFSDSVFEHYKCPQCGKTSCGYSEG